jgi:hypothetical protein
MRRRDLLKRAALAGIAVPLGSEPARADGPAVAAITPQSAPAGRADPLSEGTLVRHAWVTRLTRMAEPVCSHLAAGTLKRSMPVEGDPDRRALTHLEALGRTLAGLAPWIELPADDTAEGRARGRFARMAADAIRQATDPASPDALNFTEGGQPLVDAAFLAHAIVRAPRALWEALDTSAQRRVATALAATRRITPGYNNWLLFSAMVEAALCRAGEPWDQVRVDYALRQHEAWYKGDGVYGDGPAFHWDYYNSFVIQPMLLDVLAVCGDARDGWRAMRAGVGARAARYAVIQERLVGPDGSFPPIGRSLAYRCGAFQLLAQVALRRELPPELPPAQARAALDAVIRRTLDARGTFDEDGWLQIGLCGHQPALGERYISTGSLYLASTAFLPLGLPPDDPFWVGPGLPWTGRRAWSGETVAIDGALKEQALGGGR